MNPFESTKRLNFPAFETCWNSFTRSEPSPPQMERATHGELYPPVDDGASFHSGWYGDDGPQENIFIEARGFDHFPRYPHPSLPDDPSQWIGQADFLLRGEQAAAHRATIDRNADSFFQSTRAFNRSFENESGAFAYYRPAPP